MHILVSIRTVGPGFGIRNQKNLDAIPEALLEAENVGLNIHIDRYNYD